MKMNTTKLDFCSTREVANLLGLSLGTVQKMVEDGILEAWKTSGGHRRILRSSVDRYLQLRGHSPINLEQKPNKFLSLLIVEDDEITQELYKLTINDWKLPIHLTVVGDALSGLLFIAKNRPDILITDLKMSNVDGFEFMDILREDNSFNLMDIIVITGMPSVEIAERGGLPRGVTVLSKPIPFYELRGYLNAKLVAADRSN
jgi:excisionase family DNA binding protein